MLQYLKRLVRAGVAYQAGDILSKGVAVFTLPLYTHYVSATGYGYVESLLTAVILLSILLRLGVGEAFIRFYYDDADVARRDRIATGAVARGLRLIVLKNALRQIEELGAASDEPRRDCWEARFRFGGFTGGLTNND